LKEVCVVNISGIDPYIFGNNQFAFFSLENAVDFIRNKATQLKLKEVWNDIYENDDGETVGFYLAFEADGNNEYRIRFNYEKVR